MGKKDYFKSRQSGITTLITVLFLAMVATFVVAVIQSRLLVSIFRQKSLSDVLRASYGAESETYDLLTRIISYGMSFPPDYQRSDNGTELTVDTTIDANFQRMTVTAQRPFSVQRLEIVSGSLEQSAVSNMEIILALDCTGSMNSPADPNCDPRRQTCISRMQEQKNAAISFIQGIANLEYAENFKIGVTVFEHVAIWFPDANGVNITPTYDTSASKTAILSALNTQLTGDRNTSLACDAVQNGGTNVGAGFAFANAYFAATPPDPNTKRAEVLITDGLPSSRITDAMCPSEFGAGYNYDCIDCQIPALDYLLCPLVDRNSTYIAPTNNKSYYGTRDPGIAVYTVTILPPEELGTVDDIFGAYSTAYLYSDDATKLTEFMNLFLEQINEGITTLTIRPVVP